jgi:hypothetical protein
VRLQLKPPSLLHQLPCMLLQVHRHMNACIRFASYYALICARNIASESGCCRAWYVRAQGRSVPGWLSCSLPLRGAREQTS